MLVYDLTRHRAHCLNHTASSIWQRCNGRTTIPELAAHLDERLRAPLGEDLVRLALGQLDDAQLLEARTPTPLAGRRISRRHMVRQLGWGAVIALPTIVSIIAPEAAQAMSCTPLQSSCSTSLQCCPGNNGPCCKNGSCTSASSGCNIP